jgi:hypothetical protein
VQLGLLADGEAVGEEEDAVHAAHGLSQQRLGLDVAHVEGDVGQVGELERRRVAGIARLHSHVVPAVACQRCTCVIVSVIVNITTLAHNEPGVPLTTASPCAPVPPMTTIFSMMVEEDML